MKGLAPVRVPSRVLCRVYTGTVEFWIQVPTTDRGVMADHVVGFGGSQP